MWDNYKARYESWPNVKRLRAQQTKEQAARTKTEEMKARLDEAKAKLEELKGKVFLSGQNRAGPMSI